MKLLNQFLIEEVKAEGAATRKVLEAVPLDKADWKPHEKSMSIGRLATHIAEIPGWVGKTLLVDELDFAKTAYKPVVAETKEELLAIHDKMVAEAVAVLENVKPEDFDQIWTMRAGEQIFYQLPKDKVLRRFAFSHLYHHRGQLSVYLRLLDVPVPGVYGPTADER